MSQVKYCKEASRSSEDVNNQGAAGAGHARSRRSRAITRFLNYQTGVPSTRAFDFARDGVEVTQLPDFTSSTNCCNSDRFNSETTQYCIPFLAQPTMLYPRSCRSLRPELFVVGYWKTSM